jgi:hypothetical protein
MIIRTGVQTTLGAIQTQLPYPYKHIVFWTVHIMLSALAVETGVNLATGWNTRLNGNGEYSPADDNVSWPLSPSVWYLNLFLQTTASNVIFALFVEGLLCICEKLDNPLSTEDTSLSERVFGK